MPRQKKLKDPSLNSPQLRNKKRKIEQNSADSESVSNQKKMKLSAVLKAPVAKSTMFVGAHISAAGGVHNAVTNAVNIGCKSFALFLKSQRQWNAKPLDPIVIKKFKTLLKENNFEPHLIVPHGSYLINCGSPSPETLTKSREALIAELQRCEQLGLTRYNFHPGSTCGKQSIEQSIQQIASCINEAHSKTKFVTAVIENMSCQGNTIGGKFEELAAIIDLVKDKSRIGVCLDTCHAFAAGFDLRTEEGYYDMMTKFDKIIGFKYLKALHINDSKGDLGCHLDRHEQIGKGKIGMKAFSLIMNDSRLGNIPLILETPDEHRWEQEIKTLYSLIKT